MTFWVTHSKDHCNYSTHKVFSVFPSHCSVVAFNSGRSRYSVFPKCPQPQLQQPLTNWLKVKVMLRLTVNWSVYLDVKHPPGAQDQIFITDRCRFVDVGVPSLTRGWVYRLQLLLALASVFFLRSKSRKTRDHILLSQIRDSPNLECQVLIFISPGNRLAQLNPQVLDSLFVASYDSQGYGGGIRTRLQEGSWLSLTGLLKISQHGLHRKHCSSVSVSNFCCANMLVSQVVIQ
jgi:hypothetical protein